MSNPDHLTIQDLNQLLHDRGLCSVEAKLQPPARGFVNPPTYAKTGCPYNLYQRHEEGQDVPCVCLNNVGAEANLMKQALYDAVDEGVIKMPFPRLVYKPGIEGMPELTARDMAHRVFDARFVHSEIGGVPFCESKVGKAIVESERDNMTGFLLWAPLDIPFGGWDSHHHFTEALKRQRRIKPDYREGRVVTAEIHGIGILVRDRAVQLQNTANFPKDFPLKGYDDGYFDELEVRQGKEPAAVAGLTQAPAVDAQKGGVHMKYALYSAWHSGGLLRRMKFPRDDGKRLPEREHAARLLLLTLGLLAQTLRFDEGFYLRSGCDLILEEEPVFTLYGTSMKSAQRKVVSTPIVLPLFEEALAHAKNQGFEWEDRVIEAVPKKGMRKRLEDMLTGCNPAKKPDAEEPSEGISSGASSPDAAAATKKSPDAAATKKKKANGKRNGGRKERSERKE